MLSLVSLALDCCEEFVASAPPHTWSEERTRNSTANSSSFVGRSSSAASKTLEGTEKSIRPKTKALHCEAVVKPGGLVVDLEKLADIARCHGVPLIVVNTTATPRGRQLSSTVVLHAAHTSVLLLM